jgi:ribosomal protein S18 acetylase RimI-like enzyme
MTSAILRLGKLGEETYRPARASDIPAMAQIRAADWGNEEYWRRRIAEYLNRKMGPKEALRSRTSFVCVREERIVGLVAGHLTRRFDCEGELEWISVRQECRGKGVASRLFLLLAEWFIAHGAHRVCVDVDPANEAARRFYERHGAVDLRRHWMVWKDIQIYSQNSFFNCRPE